MFLHGGRADCPGILGGCSPVISPVISPVLQCAAEGDRDWRMLQISSASPPAPSFSTVLCVSLQAARHCLDSDPGIFMICGHHARFLAGEPSFRPACLGPNDRGSSGDSGGAVRPRRATGRRIEGRMAPGAAAWAKPRRWPSPAPGPRRN